MRNDVVHICFVHDQQLLHRMDVSSLARVEQGRPRHIPGDWEVDIDTRDGYKVFQELRCMFTFKHANHVQQGMTRRKIRNIQHIYQGVDVDMVNLDEPPLNKQAAAVIVEDGLTVEPPPQPCSIQLRTAGEVV